MLTKLKKRLYFIVARYFVFWAKFVLKRWQPRVIVLTGSSGKTTLMHLLEAQLGKEAYYSHLANSSYGIPFDILGLKRQNLYKREWLGLILKAPYKAFKKPPSQKIYIAEADCDRPNEGKFLAGLLKPEVTLWVSLTHTHAQNFDNLVGKGRAFNNHAQAIAYEFGHYIANTTKMIAVNYDTPAIRDQLPRVPDGVIINKITLDRLEDYHLGPNGTEFVFKDQKITLPGLQPKPVAISLQMAAELLNYLGQKPTSYKTFMLPPGRSSIFKGVKGATLIDSSYNTGLSAGLAMLELFDKYPAKEKWLVLGDMLEQGSLEESEHTRLAEAVIKLKLDNLVLVGPRVKKYVLPLLSQSAKFPVVWFDGPKEALDYLEQNLKNGEVILFKGARFLEGIIEQLLEDPNDSELLPRRGPLWTKRRQDWGLPR